MANKNNNLPTVEGESFKSKLGTTVLVLIITIVWLLIFALLIKLDIAGMGTRLRPLIKDVPYLNYILPPVSDDVLISENNYPYEDITEAIDIIKQLEDQVATLEDKNSKYAGMVLDLQSEVSRLQQFEDDQAAFEERVKRFDINVVYNSQAPDISEYKKYYDEINPETASKLYKEVVEQLQYDSAIKEKADILKNMKPGQAAAALEEMTADIEYTCKILLSMKTAEATEIMNKMDTLFVARILQTMHDMDEEWYEKIQNNLLKNQ